MTNTKSGLRCACGCFLLQRSCVVHVYVTHDSILIGQLGTLRQFFALVYLASVITYRIKFNEPFFSYYTIDTENRRVLFFRVSVPGMNFLGSPATAPSQFPTGKKLDASFPTLLKDENTWRTAKKNFGQRFKGINSDLEGEDINSYISIYIHTHVHVCIIAIYICVGG